jgi:hypothetical protein
MYLSDATFHTAVLMTPLTLCWTGLIDVDGLIDMTRVRSYDSVVSVVIASLIVAR